MKTFLKYDIDCACNFVFMDDVYISEIINCPNHNSVDYYLFPPFNEKREHATLFC